MKKLVKVLSLILVVFTLSFILTACVPKSAEDAVVKMEEKGYTVTLIDQDYLLTEGAVIGFKAYNVSEKQGMTAYWFNSKKEAKAYLETWTDSMYEEKGIKGLCVYAGTKKAIKDFKS
jgi:uncharacterized protein YxeA